MQIPEDMSEEAKIAYQAFLDMKHSKAAHFACLQAIDKKYESGGVPGPAENRELEKLLATHDGNVLAFKTALDCISDCDEKAKLVQLLS